MGNEVNGIIGSGKVGILFDVENGQFGTMFDVDVWSDWQVM